MTSQWPAVIELDSCTSTNDIASERARAGAPHGTIIWAKQQSAGRGRLGRTWYSNDQTNLYFSVLLRPDLVVQDVPSLTLTAGVAICETMRSFELPARLKWPNDILVGDKKLGGILAEMSLRGNNVGFVVVGIGINVGAESFPEEIADVATSMYREGAPHSSRRGVEAYAPRTVLMRARTALQKWFGQHFAGERDEVFRRWEAYAELPRQVATKDALGTATGLSPRGGLLLTTVDGQVEITAGDVVEIKPPQ